MQGVALPGHGGRDILDTASKVARPKRMVAWLQRAALREQWQDLSGIGLSSWDMMCMLICKQLYVNVRCRMYINQKRDRRYLRNTVSAWNTY